MKAKNSFAKISDFCTIETRSQKPLILKDHLLKCQITEALPGSVCVMTVKLIHDPIC